MHSWSLLGGDWGDAEVLERIAVRLKEGCT